MIKKYRGILLTIIVILLLAGCGQSSSSSSQKDTDSEQVAGNNSGVEAKEIRVAIQPIPQYGPIFIAKKKGWLEEELAKVGVRVKWTSFPAGPPMNESFTAGEQDVGLLGDSPAIIAKSAGLDTRIIGLTSTGPKALALVVEKNSKISSPGELKGKKVATVKGSYGHHLLSLLLAKYGLSTEDIQFINLPLADISSALAKGDIDAGVVWDPLLTKLEDKGVARVLADGTGIKKGLLVIVATNEFAANNPAVVKTFLKIYQQGLEFIKANPQEAANIISEEVKLSPEQTTKVLAKFDFNPGLHADDIEEIKKTEEFMRKAGITKGAVDIDSFVDESYGQGAGIQ